MVAASLLHYPRDRSQATVVAVVFGALLVVLGLLAFGAILGAGMVANSPVDGTLMAPFRWPTARFDSA